MRTLIAGFTGLCSLGSGIGLTLAVSPTPVPASAAPRHIATARPMATATLAAATSDDEVVPLPAETRGTPCSRSQLGWLSQDAGTVLVCSRNEGTPHWVVAVG